MPWTLKLTTPQYFSKFKTKFVQNLTKYKDGVAVILAYKLAETITITVYKLHGVPAVCLTFVYQVCLFHNLKNWIACLNV